MAARIGLLACTLVLAACSTGDDDGGPTTTSAESGPEPTTPSSVSSTTGPTTTIAAPTTSVLPVATGELGTLDAALSDDGTLGLDQALALVAAGYAPLPGTTAADAPLLDGGPALRTALAAGDDLRADQLTALAAITAPPGVDLAQAATGSPRLAAAAAIIDDAFTAFRIGRAQPLPSSTRVTVVELPYANADGTHNFSSAESHATALPLGDEAEPECRIRVNASSTLDAGYADPAFVSTLAQEAYHGLQYAVAPSIAAVPVWVVEGAAAFAGDDVAGANPVSTPWWQRWVGEPQRPLERRTYDALGFFAMLGEAASAYPFAEALLGDWSTASIRRRLELTDVFDRWGTHYATTPTWGPAFAFAAPGTAGLTAPRQSVTLQVDGPAVALGGAALTELSAAPYQIALPGDVLAITTSPADRGGLRFGDGQAVGLKDATQSFCLRPDGCACPGVDPDSLAVTDVASREVFIGIGPSMGGGPALAAHSLAQWCQQVLVPAPPAGSVDPCLVGTWTSRRYVPPAVAGVEQTATGGEGALVTFGADRTVSVDMAATTPVVLTATNPDGSTTTTTLEYHGAGTGTWSAAEGVLEIAGVDTTTFTVGVTIETPDGAVSTEELPATDVRLAGIAGLLGTGRYECTAVSLRIARVVPGIGATSAIELTP